MAKSLKYKAAKGLLWGALTSGATQLLNVVFGIIFGRLLSPADIGLVGMITIFTVLANNLQESGFFTALANEKNPTHRDFNSVFWFCLSLSLAIYTILFFSAPLIAAYYHQPQLTWLARFVFISFIFSSLGIAHGAWMFRKLMVRERAVVMVVSLLISGGVGIVLAMKGYSYWSLAWQQVIFNLVYNIGRFYYTQWHPTLSFDFEPVRRMFRFSNKILIPTVVNTISQHFLTVIFGRLFPVRTVGYFTQAFKWNTMGYQFVADSVAQIAQPVMVQVSEEHDRQLRVMRQMLRFTAFAAFPALFGLAIVADEFIVVLLTAKWQPAVPLLQVLCLGGAFMPFYKIYQNFIISCRRSDIYMWLNIMQVVLQIAIVLAFSRRGIMAMIVAYTVLNVAWLALWQHFAGRLSDLRWRHVIAETLPYMLIAAASMAAAYMLTAQADNMIVRLIARIMLGASLYLALLRMLRMPVIDECLNFLRHRHS